MNLSRRKLLLAMAAVPAAAAAAPLLRLLPEPAMPPVPNYDAFLAASLEQAYALPLVYDPWCPPGRIYLLNRQLVARDRDAARLLEKVLNRELFELAGTPVGPLP